MSILGCDPGIYGALHMADTGQAADMPVYEKPAGPRQTLRKFISRRGVVQVLKAFQLLGAETLVIEKTGGVEGQGVHAAYMFGQGHGMITGAAEALGYRVEEVPPATWKSALRVSADKAKAMARATELLPAWANLWAPVRGNGSEAVRSGRAEAAMLALYGRQVFGELEA